jgi:hypothetical protein
MQPLTISGAQMNAMFGAIMPVIVAFVAGLLRQDSFATPKLEWINELIFHVVILGLALAQTALGGTWGGSSISNFVIVASLSYGALSTKYGNGLLAKVQTASSIGKAPPAPAPQLPQININVAALAALLLDELRKSQPIDQQPTSQIPALQVVRENTPPQQGG